MPVIDIINLGTIPARTKVSIIGGIPFPTKDTVFDAAAMKKEYECMDCAFKTQVVEEMLEHQKNQQKYHSIWQRLKRWWRS